MKTVKEEDYKNMESYQYARFLLESDDYEGSAQYYSQILVESFSGHPQVLFDISRSLFDAFKFLTSKSDYSTLKDFAQILRREFVGETETKTYSNEMNQVVRLFKEIMQLAILVGASEGKKDKSEYKIALKNAQNLDRVTGKVHDFLPWVANLT